MLRALLFAVMSQKRGQVHFLIAHNAQGPQRKLRALLFVVLVFVLIGLRVCESAYWLCARNPIGASGT